jgi:hypothetical protein
VPLFRGSATRRHAVATLVGLAVTALLANAQNALAEDLHSAPSEPAADSGASVLAAEAAAPWEAEDLRAPAAEEQPSQALGPLSTLVLSGIRFYQLEIGPNSVSRCPYLVSCSSYAKLAIGKYGFFGLPIFFDRFFFRENEDTFAQYPRYMGAGGVLRYDDTIRDP